MLIALLFSGHVRTFPKCLDNILENIIKPLENQKWKFKIFISSWDIENTYNIDLTNCGLFFDKIQVEKYDQSKFLKYQSRKWVDYSNLACSVTHSNAISMHYKMYCVWKLMEEYEQENNMLFDIVIRIRPDVFYNNSINIQNFNDCINDNCVYMPKWNNLYENVTKQLMDHFAFGNRCVMKKYFSVFENINTILNIDCPHTSEGFLFIAISNIPIIRIEMDYGILRQNGQIHIIY